MHTQTQNDYSFDQFVQQRDHLDDFENPFLKQVFEMFSGDEDWNQLDKTLKAFSEQSSAKWKKWIGEFARVENHPTLRHFDAYNHRIDQIVRPQEMIQFEQDVFSSGLFSSDISPEEKTMKRFLLHHNGEAGVMCPIACTDGLIALLEYFHDELSPELTAILHHAKEGINGDFAIGAQFMSEIQGGSNIPANVLEAVPDGKHYRLYGNKFFCSAAHADYSVVTARIQGTDHVAVFIVPTWLGDDKEKQHRNGHVLNRLKWKIGTSELPSAEIDYQGALAYQVGPADKGVSLAVGIVLTLSRLDIGFASGAFMMRATREALLYSRFRDVFDRRIDEFPMAKAQLETLSNTAKRTTATAFKIFNQYIKLSDHELSTKMTFQVRELILLQKIFASRDTVDMLRMAISMFGGHGAIEDFSSIPRLYRDATVNELWEGPRNVLLSQIYRDLLKNQDHYAPSEFIQDLLVNSNPEIVEKYQQKLTELLQNNLYDQPTTENVIAAREWEQFWSDVFYLYQEQALREVPDRELVPVEVLSALS